MPKRRTCLEWADEKRILPPDSAESGPFRSSRTPYLLAIAEALNDPKFKRVVLVCGSQMGKTEFCLNAIGHRLDESPIPILFICPTQRLVETISQNRFRKMVQSVGSLFAKWSKGKTDKIGEKYIGGVRVGFCWASSANELSSHSAGLCFLDELDRMPIDVQKEGSPVELAEARVRTYADGRLMITSTPTIEEKSPIWKLFEEGTRFEWSVPCPDCEKYFVPKLERLKWNYDDELGYISDAWLECPHCEFMIDDSYRKKLNEKGRYVTGKNDVSECLTCSFWVSGLCSPWQSYMECASKFAFAEKSGELGRVRAVVNTVFGECWKMRGEAPTWEQVFALRQPYQNLALPIGCRFITAGVDVQKDCLYYSVRAWTDRGESFTIDYGIIRGDTDEFDVWDDLQELLLDSEFESDEGRFKTRMVAIDSSYRGYMAYIFSKKNPGRAIPVRGHDEQRQPLYSSNVDLNYKGRKIKKGVKLFNFDDFYFKSLLHSRINRGAYLGPEAWHLPEDISEEFCRQTVAEEMVATSTGRVKWLLIYRENHWLDTEKQNEICGHILNVSKARGIRKKGHKILRVLKEGLKDGADTTAN